jgi:hypothetical protein
MRDPVARRDRFGMNRSRALTSLRRMIFSDEVATLSSDDAVAPRSAEGGPELDRFTLKRSSSGFRCAA